MPTNLDTRPIKEGLEASKNAVLYTFGPNPRGKRREGKDAVSLQLSPGE